MVRDKNDFLLLVTLQRILVCTYFKKKKKKNPSLSFCGKRQDKGGETKRSKKIQRRISSVGCPHEGRTRERGLETISVAERIRREYFRRESKDMQSGQDLSRDPR